MGYELFSSTKKIFIDFNDSIDELACMLASIV